MIDEIIAGISAAQAEDTLIRERREALYAAVRTIARVPVPGADSWLGSFVLKDNAEGNRGGIALRRNNKTYVEIQVESADAALAYTVAHEPKGTWVEYIKCDLDRAMRHFGMAMYKLGVRVEDLDKVNKEAHDGRH